MLFAASALIIATLALSTFGFVRKRTDKTRRIVESVAQQVMEEPTETVEWEKPQVVNG